MLGKNVFVVVIHDHIFKCLLRNLKYLYNIIGVKKKQADITSHASYFCLKYKSCINICKLCTNPTSYPVSIYIFPKIEYHSQVYKSVSPPGFCYDLDIDC